MSEAVLLDVLRHGLRIALLASAPVLAVAMLAGVVIGLFQALTSIQEMTLTFVPKLAAILGVFWVTMGYSGRLLVDFFQTSLLPLIAGGG